MEDPIDQIISIYEQLSEFDRGRLAQALKMIDSSPRRGPGRPVGAKTAKPDGAAVDPAAAEVR
jgi:hypothetical protein